MAFIDLPLEQLEIYKPDVAEPSDFDAFWERTLAEARAFPLDVELKPYTEIAFSLVDVFDLTFSGYGGQRIKGWFVLPRQHDGHLPCVVEYNGYGGGRGLPLERLMWANLGYAHLFMDNRGQGLNWGVVGDTPDDVDFPLDPHVAGMMTRGIDHPDHYYYRRLFTDAVRAVEVARSHPAVDSSRIIITGGSQGGGISLAVAGLVPDLKAVMPDVPFLCHFRVATEITDGYPYQEIVQYCKFRRERVEGVFHTLSYFDGVNFAKRASAPALFSVGLMDDICPPRTVYAAYNHYAGEKSMRVYPYNHHEGGGTFHVEEKIRFAATF